MTDALLLLILVWDYRGILRTTRLRSHLSVALWVMLGSAAPSQTNPSRSKPVRLRCYRAVVMGKLRIQAIAAHNSLNVFDRIRTCALVCVLSRFELHLHSVILRAAYVWHMMDISASRLVLVAVHDLADELGALLLRLGKILQRWTVWLGDELLLAPVVGLISLSVIWGSRNNTVTSGW